ncbi:hypothetical protein CAPTEDRAFT_196414, partial [Capitella teleta]
MSDVAPICDDLDTSWEMVSDSEEEALTLGEPSLASISAEPDIPLYSFTWDNVQFREVPRHETAERGPKMHLFGLSFATENQVLFDSAREYHRKAATDIPLSEILPKETWQAMRRGEIHEVERILQKHLPWLSRCPAPQLALHEHHSQLCEKSRH